jgi:hypothetical protein
LSPIKFKVAKVNLNNTNENPDTLIKELKGRLGEVKSSLPSFNFKIEKEGEYLKVVSIDLEEHVN